MKIMRSNFIEGQVFSRILSYYSMIYPHNCSRILTIESPNDISSTDFLMGHTILNFCYYGEDDLRANVFIKQCTEQDMGTKKPGIKQLISCIRRRSIDSSDSKELKAAFYDYLNTKERPSRKEKMEYKRGQDLYQCLVSKERYSTSGEYSFPGTKECFGQYYQSIKNTSKNLRPLAPSSNSSYLEPLPNSNQANNISIIFIVFIMFIFSSVALLICKHGNKLLHRNENADRDLPMNQLGNKKTRRRSNIEYAESPCLKLANCVGSCEQNCKRGY